MKITRFNSEIIVYSYSLKTGSFIKDPEGKPLTYRFANCLLSAFYSDMNWDWTPDETFYLIDAYEYKSKEGWDVQGINEQLRKLAKTGQFDFDFAGGSRKHGRFFASHTGDLISQYFLEKDKHSRVISHGSILTSHSHNGMVGIDNIPVGFVDDDLLEVQQKYRVGDGYGLISWSLASKLDTVFDKKGFSWKGQTQFRCGVKAKEGVGWTAKGTVQVCDEIILDGKSVDLLLCKSHLKGHKLEMIHQIQDLILGAMDSSNKVIKSKVPTAVLNMFKTKPVQDWLKEQVAIQCEVINDMRQNIKALAQWVVTNSEDFDESVKHEQSLLYIADILANAEYPEQLFNNPKVCDWASNVLSKSYLNAAITAGLKAWYLMAAPDIQLPHKVLITDAVPPGRYLIWRLPIESRASIDIATVFPSNNRQYKLEKEGSPVLLSLDNKFSNVFINPEYFKRFGGDFDRDALNLFPVDDLPFIIEEVESWGELPHAEKPAKSAINGDKYDIVSKSVNVNVGTPFNLMMKFMSLDLMTDKLALQFAEQIKIATDSYKTDAEPNEDFLKWASDYFDKELGSRTHWMSFNQHKSKKSYLKKPITTHCDDTISQMVKVANSLWSPIIWKEQQPSHNFRFMFADATVSQDLADWATIKVTNYNKLIRTWQTATQNMEEEMKMKLYIQMVYQPWSEPIIQALDKKTIGMSEEQIQEKRYVLCAALWKAFHYKPASSSNHLYRKCSAIWKLFPEEIKRCLDSIHFHKFGLWKNSPSSLSDYGNKVWDNNDVLQVTVVNRDDKLWLIDTQTGKTIARISKQPNAGYFVPPIGLTCKVIIKTVLNRSGQISRHDAIIVKE